jgi:hypothetical protein
LELTTTPTHIHIIAIVLVKLQNNKFLFDEVALDLISDDLPLVLPVLGDERKGRKPR